MERKAPDILLLVDFVQNVRWTLGVIDFYVESKRKTTGDALETEVPCCDSTDTESGESVAVGGVTRTLGWGTGEEEGGVKLNAKAHHSITSHR